MECPKIYNAVDSHCSAPFKTFCFGDAVVVYCALLKVAPYSFTIARALATKVQAICAHSKGNVSDFLYFITST